MGARNILLVDDDSIANYLTRLIIEDNWVDGKVDIALDGQHALDLIEAREQCPDVIFLDVNMPIMDGFDFLKEFQGKASCYNHARVYMLSSSIREEDRQLALSFTCVKDYLEKPLTAEAIRKVFGA